MKRTAKLLGLGLVALTLLWGCGGKPQSQNPTTGEENQPQTVAQAATETEVTPSPQANGKRPFITKWRGEAGKTIKIAAVGTYTLTWYNEATPNERHTEQVTVRKESDESYIIVENPYTFTTPTDGVYVVEVGPEGVEAMHMRNFDGDRETASRLLSVVQFGDVAWKDLSMAFYWCSNMQFEKGIDTPNLSQCTNLSWMFEKCAAFNSPVGDWDVSHVTDMKGMFSRCTTFNQPLEKWNVSNVTDMTLMFLECEAFNQPLNGWNVGKVTAMVAMFAKCRAFNQPLDKWNVSQVTYMYRMFEHCNAFNQPLNSWDVSRVTDMKRIFSDCTAFNQPLDGWKLNDEAETHCALYGTHAVKLPFAAKWNPKGEVAAEYCQYDDEGFYVDEDELE